MPRTPKFAARLGSAAFAVCLFVCLLLLASDSTPNLQRVASAQALCPQVSVPAITHGFATSDRLPQGDHFLLPQPFTFTIPSSANMPGLRLFQVNEANFGGDVAAIGGFAGTRLAGVSYAMPDSNVTMLSCNDSVWDFSFLLAGTGATAGDTVGFFLQRPDGGGDIRIAVFTHESGGARVTALHPSVQLYSENRLANGAGRLQAGDLIPLNQAAGAAGRRSGLLTVSFDPSPGSPFNGCFQFGANIRRGAGAGTSSLVITDVVLKRMEQRGDRNLPERGLIGGLTGGYPTALVCPVICPECTPTPVPCPMIFNPAVTHGFATSDRLPQGDHFLLREPFALSVPVRSPMDGFDTFMVNRVSFGGDAEAVGGFPGTNLMGFSYNAQGGSVTALSCNDSVWDFSFLLASAGATAGDKVTLFLQKPDGSGVITLAVFTHESGGARVTELNPNLQLFRGNRLATGAGRLFAGDLIPLNVAAGAAGNRSALLTIAFEQRADSPLNDCFQFGATIARDGGRGVSSLVFTDFVLKREERTGDRARLGMGLIGGLTGGWPTGLVCPVVCPACPLPPVPCPEIQNPAVTHGFVTNDRLPQGDHFLLDEPFTLTVPFRSPMDGFNVFNVNPTTFGGNALGLGGFRGTELMGFGYRTPGGSVTALSCNDSLWDFSFLLASAGVTMGDKVTFFVQKPDGSGQIILAVFDFEGNDARVVALNPNLQLYRGNRLAIGAGRLQVGDLIPFGTAAGAAGNRSPLLTIAFEMRADSPLNDCFQFGATIARGRNTGVTSLVFTDFVLKRMERAGDRDRRGMGLIGGLTGGWPTGLVCPVICPACPPLPRIDCPPNQTACAEVGASSAVVNYPAPTAVPPNASVSCSPPSGASFPLGVMTVMCTASIGGRSASCSFTVTVTPRLALTCPGDIKTTATSASGATVTYPAPTVTPAGTAVSCSPPSGSTFPVGTTTVTCSARNDCGPATCSFTVMVMAPPRVTCPPNQSVCAVAGATSAVVTYPAPTVAPDVASVSCTPASGASFPLGLTTVTCTAVSGTMTDTCSFTVRVQARPAITCPANITTTAAGPGGGGATVSYTTPTATPAGTPVTCAPASGAAFPIGTTTVTCTATNECGTATCSFTVTVQPLKCDTFCWHSPQWWLLNPRRIPQGNVLISGVNGNQSVSTDNRDVIHQVLQGNPTGFGLTPMQRFNQEYLTAQLNLLAAGGGGSVVNANVQWANLSCYNISFAPVPLSNGAVLSSASMVKDLFMQAQFAVMQNRTADFAALATLLDRFNGNDLFGCN